MFLQLQDNDSFDTACDMMTVLTQLSRQRRSIKEVVYHLHQNRAELVVLIIGQVFKHVCMQMLAPYLRHFSMLKLG